MKNLSSTAKITPVLIAIMLLCGCAEQRLRDAATADMRNGNFEAAIHNLKEGVQQYPDSALLKSGLALARNETTNRLIAQVAQLRSQSKLDEADKVIQRGLELEPENARLKDLKNDLLSTQHLRRRLEEIQQLIAEGKKNNALRKLEIALRETPRQADLIALQRRLQLEIRLENSSYQGGLVESRPITLDFKNAPLSAVLDAITRGSGINFVLDKDLRLDSRVTVYLRNAQVGDAIDLVVGANQLARNIVDPQTVFIYSNTPEKKREHQEQIVRIFYLASAEAKTTAALLRAMLHLKEPFIDERANMLAIRESPEIVALAERLVALHDVSEPEVMLEVEIMEVSATNLTNLGLDFPNSLTFTPLPETGATALTLNSLQSINASRTGVSISNLVLNLRREVGDTNILANPRIRAKNKEKARILIGDKVPIITSTSSSTGFVSQSVNYQDVGLKLDVEPVISPDEEVTIKLALEVSNLGNQVTTSSGSIAYQISTRNANTTLRLRDGETQLLGGLINKQDTSSAHRVPGLGDLPVVGRLFSSQFNNGQRTELMLAITPRILRSAPRPDIAEAEMWVGSEVATRWLNPPSLRQKTVSNSNNTSIKPKIQENSQQLSQPANPSLPIKAVNLDSTSKPPSAMWKGPENVKAGEIFTVSLWLSSERELRGAPLEIEFPTTLEIVEIIEGTFFKQDEGITSFTQAINAATGRISAGILRSDTSGARGNASLLELRLKAQSTGTIQLQLTNLKPISLGMPSNMTELPSIKINVQ